ncbi:hypothetical protein RRG08_025191 [Elysia crispata]|uniref:Proline-rich transmembrane protein 1 n=1 Tax=Elysia crispata TaxID=231223 RepID=A0AAE0ZC72_9GAST|nr:hypothetical protein RRG08_025191 [Elysia crispata]
MESILFQPPLTQGVELKALNSPYILATSRRGFALHHSGWSVLSEPSPEYSENQTISTKLRIMQGEETKGYNPDMPGQGYPPHPPPQYYQGQTVVVPQPQPMIIQREGDQVQDNLVISIISIFFCCILGIIATVKASNSKDSLRRGEIAKAQEESVSARKLAIAAIITGIVIFALVIFINVILPLAFTGIAIGINS